MASFLGDREALTPKAGKRKLGRSASAAGDAGPSSSDDFMSDSSIKKRKKKKHVKEEAEEIPELAVMSALKLDQDAVVDLEVTWSKDESQTLLDKIKSLIPPNDTMKYTTRIDKLDWELAKFEPFTAEQCKAKWTKIATNVRKFRLLGELVADAKSFVANPPHKSVMKHPDMPKRPLTPYFRFFLAKRAKIAAKHPELSQTDLTKVISKEFRELSDKKRKKYQEEYDTEMQEFHVKLAKFKENHPDLYPEKNHHQSTGGSGPPKPITAMHLYINSKAEDAVKKETKLSRKQLYDQFRTKWGGLSDHKKMKYIAKAIEAKTKYDEQMRAYCALHADYVPKDVKTFLSKVEQKIKDRYDGKPEKPPPNGYGLFSVDKMTELTEVPSTERMAEVSRRWKGLAEKERDRWNTLCKEKNAAYTEAYKHYVKNLPEEERAKIESAEAELAAKRQANRKQKSPTKKVSRGKQKPVAAVFLYITEQKADYKKKYPEMGDHELTRMLAKEYTQLSDVDKDKYKLMEEEQRDILAQCLDGDEGDESPDTPPPAKKSKKKKKPSFPGEPKKPPGSGYQLFTIETLPSLSEVPNKERLLNISQKWGSKTVKEKAAFSKRRDTMVEKYKKELEKFKKKLSPKDLRRYEEGDGKSGNKGAANKKAAVADASEDDEESESGSGSSSSEDSSDSDSDSGSESNSASSTDTSDDEADDKAKPKTNGVQGKESGSKLSANDVYSSSDSDSNSSSSSDSE